METSRLRNQHNLASYGSVFKELVSLTYFGQGQYPVHHWFVDPRSQAREYQGQRAPGSHGGSQYRLLFDEEVGQLNGHFGSGCSTTSHESS